MAKRCRRCTTLDRSGSELVLSASWSQGWRSASAARMRLAGLRSSMALSRSRAGADTYGGGQGGRGRRATHHENLAVRPAA